MASPVDEARSWFLWFRYWISSLSCWYPTWLFWSLTMFALWFWYYSDYYVIDFAYKISIAGDYLQSNLQEFCFSKSAKKKFQALFSHFFPFFCTFRSVLSLVWQIEKRCFQPIPFLFPVVQIFCSVLRYSIDCSPYHGWFWISLPRQCLLFAAWLIQRQVNNSGDVPVRDSGSRRGVGRWGSRNLDHGWKLGRRGARLGRTKRGRRQGRTVEAGDDRTGCSPATGRVPWSPGRRCAWKFMSD